MRSGRSGSLSCWALVGFLFWAGCTDKNQSASAPPADTWDGYCIDQDGDGRGFQCADGDDCNDEDPAIFEGCKPCTTPNEGCACEANTAPRDCVVSKQIVEGSLLCKSGTRYCRDSKWSACEGVKTFEAPPPSHLLTRSLVDPDAGAIACSECHPDCYQIEDTLSADASYGDSGIVPGYNGGITLNSYRDDSGVADYDAGDLDSRECNPDAGYDRDCDGIPDAFDPFPGAAPFSSQHNTIFMDLGPGDVAEESFSVHFFLNTADIYLYLDMTGSMNGERTNLLASLRNGSYMPADRVNEACADRNLNGSSADEEYLKDAGIAGNLACLIRDSHIGAGWHRDLPFPRADPSGFAFGPHDFEVFQHEQDITGNIDAVLAGLNRFGTRGGINRPEGGIMGLYALATGAQLYLGWDRPGNPARTGCPAGTWGYACFRDEAVPIVIWMTDAPITNGPAPVENQFENDGPSYSAYGNGSRAQPVNWDPSALVIETGTGSTYNTVGTTHETFATAYDLGDINSSFKTYVFDSTGMRSDITYASLTGSASASYNPTTAICGSGTASAWSTTQTAPDAVFKIRVTEVEPITISTRGSRVQSAIAIVDADRIDNATLTAPAVANSQPSNPASVAAPITFPGVTNIAGTTQSATPYFGFDSVGCLTSTATDKVAASIVKFNLANDAASVRFVTDANYAASTTLFAGRPGIYTASDVALGSLPLYDNNVAKTGNSNDEMNSYNIGNMTGVYKRFTGGDTSGSGATGNTGQYLTAQYSAGMFNNVSNADTCDDAAGLSKDSVFDFSLSATTDLRIEGTGLNGSLRAGFDHMIGLVSRGTSSLHPGITGNHTVAAASTINFTDIPSEYSWTQYNGTSGGSSTELFYQAEVGPFSSAATGCTNAAAASSTSLQSVFVLTIPPTEPTRSYDFDTGGSSVNTWLSLHEDGVRPTYNTATAANGSASVPGNSTGTTATVVPQPLGLLDGKSIFVTGGSLSSSSFATAKVAPSAFGTSCGSTNGKDAVYTFTVNTTRQIRITTGSTSGTAVNANNPGFDSYIGVFRGSLGGTRVAGGCDNQTTVNASGTTANANGYETAEFTASPSTTYYVVVKNFATTSSTVTYGLWIRDTSFHTSNFLSCDYGSQPYASSVRSAKLTRALGPGTYYVVVKTTGTSAGAYQLNVRRTPTAEPTLTACDSTTGGTRHSVIQKRLAPGNYSLILRGVADGSTGTYNVIFRDLGVAPLQVACGYDANTSSAYPSNFTASNLAARDGSGNLIDYYLVMRGTTNTGTFNMRIEDASSMATTQCAFDNVTMTHAQVAPLPAYTASTDINNAEWTGTLPLGDYYVVLKGYNASDTLTDSEDNDWGQWQFSVGDQAHYEGTGTFDAKRWLGPTGNGVGGIQEAVKSRKLRVIMVDSTNSPTDKDRYSDQQMRAIASATDAVALDGTPLFYKINEDGTGLGTTIVQSINTLAGNLAMDVGVRLVESPDSPAPKHFNFRVEAVDVDGDSCSPPVDADGDSQHIVDTHTKCRPGATPLFKITISNPNPPYNVPTNPNDSQGGWNMRIDLIADGQYVVDQIPVYIIPEDVIAQPGDKKYDATGTYQDTVPATGCVGNEAPFWENLQWAGSVPGGTSLAWNVCTADTAAQLDSCTPQRAVTVTTTNGCVNSGDCSEGFCNTDSLCEVRRGPACANDSDCRSTNVQGGVCAIPAGTTLPKACLWNGEVTVTPALAAGQQGKRYARVQAVMQANTARTRAPTVNSWQLRYTCSAQE